MPAIRSLLLRHGFEIDVVETSAAGESAAMLARAAAQSSSLVLACGGDGTVHGVVQGLAQGLAGPSCALGVVPLGTANALARNLGLPLDPLEAVTQLLTWSARTIPLGQIVTSSQTRWFAVMAGCGPDGALVHTLSLPGGARRKRRFGRQAYYLHAARLFLTRRWPAFRVEFRRPASAEWESLNAVAVMASRIPDLGGLFSGLTAGASLLQPSLQVQILRPPAQLSFPAWMACGRTGLPNPWLTTVNAEEIRCTPADQRPVYAQADGEALGPLPMTLRIVPDALSLRMPERAM
jgi:diacylglycerol kinase family enzyme